MLNLNFTFLLQFLPTFIIFFFTFFIIVVNYLNHTKNTIFLKKKEAKKAKSSSQNNIIQLCQLNYLVFYSALIMLNLKNTNITTDSDFIIRKFHYFIFFLLFLLFFIVNYLLDAYSILHNKIINYNSYISIFFVLILFSVLHIKNFVLLFFFIELLSYVFYMQFLQVFNKIKTNNKKNYYFDSLIMFYWVNFFSSVFIVFSIMYLYLTFGTTDLIELKNFLNYNKNFNIFYCFLYLGFTIKLGVSGFHFLKIEIYKNLKVDAIINFSFLSVFGYLILIKTIVLTLGTIVSFIYFFIITNMLFILFLLQNLNVKNIVLFFGYSAILNTMLSLFLVI